MTHADIAWAADCLGDSRWCQAQPTFPNANPQLTSWTAGLNQLELVTWDARQLRPRPTSGLEARVTSLGWREMRKRSVWKIVGLAGLAGVAATGVVVVRSERRRRAYTPDEVRIRLHQRVAAIAAIGDAVPVVSVVAAQPGRLRRVRRLAEKSFKFVFRG